GDGRGVEAAVVDAAVGEDAVRRLGAGLARVLLEEGEEARGRRRGGRVERARGAEGAEGAAGVREVEVARLPGAEVRLAEPPRAVGRVRGGDPARLGELLRAEVARHPADERAVLRRAVLREHAEGVGRGVDRVLQHRLDGEAERPARVHVRPDEPERPLDAALRPRRDVLGHPEEGVEDERRPRLPAADDAVRGAVPAAVFGLLAPEVLGRAGEGAAGAGLGLPGAGGEEEEGEDEEEEATHRTQRGWREREGWRGWKESMVPLLSLHPLHPSHPLHHPRWSAWARSVRSRSAVRARMTAAVQKTGLVMQWCPLQLPSPFW